MGEGEKKASSWASSGDCQSPDGMGWELWQRGCTRGTSSKEKEGTHTTHFSKYQTYYLHLNCGK